MHIMDILENGGQVAVSGQFPSDASLRTEFIITRSKNCTICPEKVRLVPFADLSAKGAAGAEQAKMCPQCGQWYVKSRNALASLRKWVG